MKLHKVRTLLQSDVHWANLRDDMLLHGSREALYIELGSKFHVVLIDEHTKQQCHLHAGEVLADTILTAT